MTARSPYVHAMLARTKTAILAALALAGLTLSAPPAQAGGNMVVVELFTSQGCNSCPPADAVLSQLSGRDDVIALSLHVDYWDYLGWRDTFAQRQFTERQVAYRDAWRKSVVYTPQMVVQGRHDVMGSQPDDLSAAIDAALADVPPVKVMIERDGGMLKCRIEPGPERTVGIVWIAKYTKSATVEITRGENAGRTITYMNVVNSLNRIGSWAGTEPEEVSMPQPDPGEGVAVWIQAGEAGPILAAARIENPPVE
ncbi:MAG: DUF1223 domain-containing protein [Paracoccaceae bacterium]